MPGCDPDSRVIRLTTNKDVLIDDQKRLVGYLGRAHPLVRHAIDRVRHTSLGDGTGQTDSRAGADSSADSNANPESGHTDTTRNTHRFPHLSDTREGFLRMRSAYSQKATSPSN